MPSPQNETVSSLFLTGLRNAHAMESQAQALLQRQIERLDEFPDLKTRLQAHLKETEEQQSRLDRILDTFGASASGMKDTAMSFLGNMAAAAHMPAEDEVIKNSLASFAFENYETAAYKSLIAMAEQVGATDAISALRQSFQEEVAMARFLDDNLASVTKRFLARAAASSAA